MSQEFRVGQRVVSLVARPEPGQPGLYQVVIDGAVRSVHVQHASDGSLLISREDGSRFTAHVSRDADERRARWVTVDGATQRFMEAEVGASDDGHDSGLEAPMPGTVFEVCVTVGQEVEAGATLVIVEAMKMEHAITAPSDGVVTSVDVKAGERVSPGKPLVGFEAK